VLSLINTLNEKGVMDDNIDMIEDDEMSGE